MGKQEQLVLLRELYALYNTPLLEGVVRIFSNGDRVNRRVVEAQLKIVKHLAENGQMTGRDITPLIPSNQPYAVASQILSVGILGPIRLGVVVKEHGHNSYSIDNLDKARVYQDGISQLIKGV